MTEQAPPGAPGARIVPASTVLLVRDTPAFEVLMVKRHHQIDFASGALVFPGGKTHAADDNPDWARHTVGWEQTPPDEHGLRIAGIREAFEEAGILLGRHADGSPFRGEERAAAARAAIVEAPHQFLELVAGLGLRLDLGALTVFSRWVTPSMMPKRFDTWFFVAAAPPDQLAICDGWETVDAEWIEPNEALRLAATGERTVIFPTRMNLQLLAEANTSDDAVARAQARPRVIVEPKVTETPAGRVLVIPADAGYGEVSQPLSSLT
jgi:8-oxo-dGTP pyrophosphatase MutT (NUDIX family)